MSLIVAQTSRGSSEDSDVLGGLCSQAMEHSAASATRRAQFDVAGVLEDAYTAADALDGPTKADAIRVLNCLAQDLLSYDLSRVPAMHAVTLDDGSLVVEWILDGRRLGLSFDRKPGESGWFYVSSQEHGNVRARGRFVGSDLAPVLSMALGRR